jgi:hypothetical protein
MNFDGFGEVVQTHWQYTGIYKNGGQDMTANIKSLTYGLEKWSDKLSQLSIVTTSCSYVLALLDGPEDQSPLSLQKKNSELHSEPPIEFY